LIAIDTNILVHAHRADSPQHAAASRCLTELAEGSASWGLPWPCLHEFFGIVTHPRVYAPPTPTSKALAQIDAWLESPTVALLTESSTHWPTLKALLTAGRISGPRVHDARIAALCLRHDVHELWTADRDFQRFPKVRTRNPLVA
jgi:toxin-antitoxin system PIN domain toxin